MTKKTQTPSEQKTPANFDPAANYRVKLGKQVKVGAVRLRPEDDNVVMTGATAEKNKDAIVSFEKV